MKRYILPVLLLLLLLPACDSDELKTVVKYLDLAADEIAIVQDQTIRWYDAELISAETSDAIMTVCAKANAAGDQAMKVIEGIDEFDATTASIIVDLLKPISHALDPAQLAFIANIQDPASRQRLELSLELVRASISAAMLILAAVG